MSVRGMKMYWWAWADCPEFDFCTTYLLQGLVLRDPSLTIEFKIIY